LGGGRGASSSGKTVHTTRLSLFFLSQEDEERGKIGVIYIYIYVEDE
jgi:hypothetical protein